MDMVVLPAVLGCRPLRRTIQVRLGTNTLRLPGGTTIFVVSRQQFMKDTAYLPLGHSRTNSACILVSGEERYETGSFRRSSPSRSRAASPTAIPWRAK
jgi:hypothetical protein